MSKIVANLNGGASDEYGTFVALNRLLTGDVIEGFQVVPNSTPNMTVKVNPGSGRITTGTYPSSYGYFVSHDTTGGESVTIPTAAASPRIDYIVAYIDKGVTAVTSPVNNTNNVLKFADVSGTPAGSPVVPTVAQIQAAIGAANPYIILAQIAVAASATTITTPNITDIRSMAYSTAEVTSSNIDFTTLGNIYNAASGSAASVTNQIVGTITTTFDSIIELEVQRTNTTTSGGASVLSVDMTAGTKLWSTSTYTTGNTNLLIAKCMYSVPNGTTVNFRFSHTNMSGSTGWNAIWKVTRF